MKTKQVFALKGPANVGKSATLKKVFALLTNAYPSAPVQMLNPPGIDMTAIIEINGIFVGLESCGDPPPYHRRLIESIELFKKAKCIIIICATRTSGVSVTTVKNLEPEFKLTWHLKTSEPQANLRDQRDDVIAQTIFKKIQNALTNP